MRRRLRISALILALIAMAGTGLGAGGFVNFESGPVRPMALSPDGANLYVLNIPDNRLEVYAVEDRNLVRLGEVLVGLEPVAVAAGPDQRVYVVNHLSDSVSVVNVTQPERPWVEDTWWTGDEPRDIVLAGTQLEKVFITAAHRGQNRPGDPQLTTPGVGRADVWVFNRLDPGAPADIITLFADTPRGLAASPDGSRVYAAAFHSGNRTTVLGELAVTSNLGANALINDGFIGLGLPPPTTNIEGIQGPDTGLIVQYDGSRWRDFEGRNWTNRVRFNLPDYDVFELDAEQEPPQPVGAARGVGTILFNVAVNPRDGSVAVSNLESINLQRFEPEIRGRVTQNRVTFVRPDAVSSVDLNSHVQEEQPAGAATELGLSTPLQLEYSSDGERLYLVAFGSGKLVVLDAAGTILGRIAVGGGPAGLALDEARQQAFVFNRFDLSISIVDLDEEREVRRIPLGFNPEPEPVRVGRRLLYDASNSEHGDQSCASCHVFGDLDGLAWDLGDPQGAVVSNPLQQVPVQNNGLRDFHPLKGPMTTQSLRGMLGAGAMHWRGDRNGGPTAPFDEGEGFLQFRGAFQSLLGKARPLPQEEMEQFRDFILTVVYPPNPIANLDGSLTPMQQAGLEVLESSGDRRGLGGDGDPCGSCHTPPLGTSGLASFEGLAQDMKVPHLRNLYQKVGMFGWNLPRILQSNNVIPVFQPTPTPHLGDQIRGFGFLHDGSIPSLIDFFRFPLMPFTFRDEPGRSGDQKVRELVAMLLAFPTGLAPAVGQQVTLSASAAASRLARFELLRARAAAGDGDLVLSGPFLGSVRGMLYQGGTGAGARFLADRGNQVITWSELEAALAAGNAHLTAMLVPPGSGRRIALDRNGDGVSNGDERRPGRIQGWQLRP